MYFHLGEFKLLTLLLSMVFLPSTRPKENFKFSAAVLLQECGGGSAYATNISALSLLKRWDGGGCPMSVKFLSES